MDAVRALSWHRLKPPFSFGFQCFLNGPRMQLDLEPLPNAPGQLTRVEFGLGGAQFLQMLADLRSQLMGALGTALAREQSFEPPLGKLILSLVDRRSR
jgi:hypothetical protein